MVRNFLTCQINFAQKTNLRVSFIITSRIKKKGAGIKLQRTIFEVTRGELINADHLNLLYQARVGKEDSFVTILADRFGGNISIGYNCKKDTLALYLSRKGGDTIVIETVFPFDDLYPDLLLLGKRVKEFKPNT